MASPRFYWDPSFGRGVINYAGRIECQNIQEDGQEDAVQVAEKTLIRHHTRGPLWRRDISQAMRLCGGRQQQVFLHRLRCTMWLMVESVAPSVAPSVELSVANVLESTVEAIVAHVE